MTAWLRRHAGALLRLGATVAVLVIAGRQLHAAWGSTPMPTPRLAPGGVLAAVLPGALALLTLAGVSAAGVIALGRAPAGPRGAFLLGWFRLWFVSYFYRYIPGKVVLLTERVRLGRHFGIPADTSVLLVLWESGLLVAGSAVFAALGYAAMPVAPASPVPPWAGLAGAGIVVAGLLLFPPALRWAAARFRTVARRVPGAVIDVPVPAQLGLVFGNAVCWGLLGLCFAGTAALLPADTAASAGQLAVWYVVSYVVGQVSSVTPAGLGVREAVLVGALADTVPAPVVLAWAVANRLLLAAVEAVLLLSSLLVPLPSAGPSIETA
jgi:hypothetical protein